MKTLLLALLLAAGCATTAEDLRIQHVAGIRRVATWKLHSCLEEPPFRPFNEAECLEENRIYCAKQGMNYACGVDGLWGERFQDGYQR